MKQVFLYIALLLPILSFFSCNDTELAEKAVGTWALNITTSYDDGSKDEATGVFKFVKEEDNDGGTFTEKRLGVFSGEEDKAHYTCKYKSTITGTWDVFAGKLELVYDIPSLKVTINADDVNLKYNSFLDELDAATYALRTLTNVTAELAKTAQKELYTDSFRSYKSMNDEGGVFNNLTIEGDKMTFDTNDMGTLHLTKITQSNDK